MRKWLFSGNNSHPWVNLLPGPKKSRELTGSKYFRAHKLIETFGNGPLLLYKIPWRQAQSPSSNRKDGGKTLPTKSQSSVCSFVFALTLRESYTISCELEIDIHALGRYQNLNSKQVHSLIFTHDSLPLYCLAELRWFRQRVISPTSRSPTSLVASPTRWVASPTSYWSLRRRQISSNNLLIT